MAQDDVPGGVGGRGSSPPEPAWPRVGRIAFWALFGLAAASAVTGIALLFVITRVYAVSTPTMENTVPAGDRVFLAPGSGIRRGDVVVLRVPVAVSGTNGIFVKRVIGLPGDHVACCDSRGRVTVNGRPLSESYLYPGDPPSRITFSARLGPGQIWVLGDRRNISADSRTWAAVPVSGVVGRVVLVNHGFSFTALHTPRTFATDGLAPADTRLDVYLVLALMTAGSLLALVVLAITGVILLTIRGRRSRQRPPLADPPLPDPPLPAEA
jgi:signal peptidase I